MLSPEDQRRLVEYGDLSKKLSDMADKDALINTAIVLATCVAECRRRYGYEMAASAVRLQGPPSTDEGLLLATDALQYYAGILGAIVGARNNDPAH